MQAYATLTKDSMTAIVTGTGLLTMTDSRDGWTATVEHEGTSDEAVAELVAEGYTLQD